MASVTHSFVSAKSDGGDDTLVRPSDWNADHVIEDLSTLGYELDYVQKTTDTSITATTEGTANTVVTANAIDFDGSTTVIVECFTWSGTTQATSNVFLTAILYDNGSSIGMIGRIRTSANLSITYPMHMTRRITPSAGSHTYSFRAWTTSGTSTVGGGAGTGTGDPSPAYIRITEVLGPGGSSAATPWHVPVPVEMTPDTSINTWTLINDIQPGAGEALNYANGGTRLTCVTSPAQNDEVAWDVVLGAGTWEFTMHHRKSSNVGIYTVTLNAISAGTIDGYSASAAVGRDVLSSIAIPTTGKYRLKLKMATKNASSSGYVGNPQAISLRRTA